MSNTPKPTLTIKLFLSYLVIILIVVVVILAVAQLVIPAAYRHHILGMQQMGMLRDVTPREIILRSFRSGVVEAILIASVIAVMAAILVSYLISRRITTPVQDLTKASLQIAAGKYDQRVSTEELSSDEDDELLQLARAFNQMAEKLEHNEKLRSQLIGDVSHELLTPLTAIKGSMQALVDGVLPATPQTFAQIEQEADRLQRLASDLQELNRVEAGAYKLQLQTIHLPDLLQTAYQRMQPYYTSKGVGLSLQIAPGLPAVAGDLDRLLQVLINLLSNARQYTPAGGQVLLSAAAQGREVVIAVRDNGVGIPAEHLPHLFTRFYRVDKSRSRQSGGGSGIGLTIARHLVEAHGGKIWAESPGAGQGSTFAFTLPAAKNT